MVLITADDVDIQKFTVRDGKYCFFLDHSEGTVLMHNLVMDYHYGIYNNRTEGAYIAHNDITNGKYGIVTDHAHNDAVRHNTISYNTVYGAKDFNSRLRNCFNWNYFHHNKIAYWYDPTILLSVLEFDGNILEDNEIGVKVSDASTVRITNNTIRNGDIGIYIENASPWIYRNAIENNRIGIYAVNSNSRIEENTITDSGNGIVVEGAQSMEILDNSVPDITMYDSTIKELSLTNTDATVINGTVLDHDLDLNSELTAKWYLRAMVVDSSGEVVSDATVKVLDINGNEVEVLQTDLDGMTGPIALTQYVLNSDGQTYHTPHTITAEKEGAESNGVILMNGNRYLMLTVPKSTVVIGFPWLMFFVVIGSVAALGVGGFLATEVGKYALLALFIPLYMKLKKENVLDHYNRGRIYQYIELNPGDHYSAIKKYLGLNSGALTYHLYVLEKASKIKSKQDGIYKRFYPYDSVIPQENGGLTEVQKRIVLSIQDLPGVSQKELASVLGVHQSTLSYQLNKLEKMGVIRSTRVRRNVRYHIEGSE